MAFIWTWSQIPSQLEMLSTSFNLMLSHNLYKVFKESFKIAFLQIIPKANSITTISLYKR